MNSLNFALVITNDTAGIGPDDTGDSLSDMEIIRIFQTING